MAHFTDSIDVNVPVRAAYNQWTQFETFPQFMEGVQEVYQLTDTRVRWRAEIGGVIQEWDAEITEQVPDRRVAWTSVSGARHAGMVTFQSLDDQTTRITLDIEYNPNGFMENVGVTLGLVNERIKGDLIRFKEFIEERGMPTGAWRGTIEHGENSVEMSENHPEA